MSAVAAEALLRELAAEVRRCQGAGDRDGMLLAMREMVRIQRGYAEAAHA